jgi:hypothetical protein
MNYAEDVATRLHNLEHAKEHMVWQIWEDGEITLQKGGDLLWRRGLHLITPGLSTPNTLDLPMKHNGHSYVFVGSKEEADLIRNLIGMDGLSAVTPLQCPDCHGYVEDCKSFPGCIGFIEPY